MHPRRWSTKDFDQMSWHDCHVHGMKFVHGEHGSGEIEFDLDYILEWRKDEGNYTFLLVPAKLCFHEVFGPRMAVDWASPTAGFGPFSLSGIERKTEDRERYTAILWRLAVNWPSGSIEFEATGFTQHAWGKEVLSPRQWLIAGERVDA